MSPSLRRPRLAKRQQDPIDILVVCTGNFCRSPMAEAMLRGRLPTTLSLQSAGTLGMKSATPHPSVGRVLASHGVNEAIIRLLRPKTLAKADVLRSRLILVAAAEHRRHVVEMVREKADRVFTLREFARLVDGYVPAGVNATERLESLIAHAGQRLGELWSDPAEMSLPVEHYDLGDPIDLELPAFERCYTDIDASLGWVSLLR